MKKVKYPRYINRTYIYDLSDRLFILCEWGYAAVYRFLYNIIVENKKHFFFFL